MMIKTIVKVAITTSILIGSALSNPLTTSVNAETLNIEVVTEAEPIMVTDLTTENRNCEKVSASYQPISKAYQFYNVPFSIEEQETLQQIAGCYGIDYKLMLAIMGVESDYKPDVIGDNGNAEGAMQIWKKWWGGLAETIGVTDYLDLFQNARLGCAILSELYAEYGTTAEVLMYYNTGAIGTDKGKEYVEKVMNELRGLVESEQ